MRDLDDWQLRVFGVNGPDEKPAEPKKGVPVEHITCQLCEYTSEVMSGFETLFYLEHVDDQTGAHHYVRAVPRAR